MARTRSRSAATARSSLRLTPMALDASVGAFAARHDAAYLITGGFGDIGLHLARAMATRGARRLILLGRSALPPRERGARSIRTASSGQRIAAVRALEAEGVAVHTAAVDVSDEAALRAFLDQLRAEGWPPIRGVIHAAGAVDDCLVHSIGAARFDAVLGPKLRGAQHLDRLLPRSRFLCADVVDGAFLPQSGQANYAAANAGLDALARDRRARGIPAVSIGWGVWEDTGLLRGADGGGPTSRNLRRQGIRRDTGGSRRGPVCRCCAESGEHDSGGSADRLGRVQAGARRA